jgi:hypothetical protein
VIAAIYTNQSRHIWQSASPPTAEQATPGHVRAWSRVWKRPQEIVRQYAHLEIEAEIHVRVTTFRRSAIPAPQIDITELKREILAEAEAVLQREANRLDADKHALLVLAEHTRLHRQAEDDEEVMLAASILFMDEPDLTWSIGHQRRKRAGSLRRKT